MQLDRELEDKLRNEIAMSGFPLELRVTKQLRDAGALVYPNLSFADRNDKPHEIDALAFLSEDELEEGWSYGPISVTLLVECKAS